MISLLSLCIRNKEDRKQKKRDKEEEEKWLGLYTITKINVSGVFTMISSTGKQIKRHGSQLKPYISADGFETHESSPPLNTAQTVDTAPDDPFFSQRLPSYRSARGSQ